MKEINGVIGVGIDFRICFKFGMTYIRMRRRPNAGAGTSHLTSTPLCRPWLSVRALRALFIWIQLSRAPFPKCLFRI